MARGTFCTQWNGGLMRLLFVAELITEARRERQKIYFRMQQIYCLRL